MFSSTVIINNVWICVHFMYFSECVAIEKSPPQHSKNVTYKCILIQDKHIH